MTTAALFGHLPTILFPLRDSSSQLSDCHMADGRHFSLGNLFSSAVIVSGFYRQRENKHKLRLRLWRGRPWENIPMLYCEPTGASTPTAKANFLLGVPAWTGNVLTRVIQHQAKFAVKFKYFTRIRRIHAVHTTSENVASIRVFAMALYVVYAPPLRFRCKRILSFTNNCISVPLSV